jgi:hypothetical protein
LIDRHAGKPLTGSDVVGQGLAVELVEPRLVVEEFLLGRAAALEQVDDAPGLGRQVRPAGRALRGRVGAALACQEGSQRHASQAEPRRGEEMAAG